MSCVVKYRLSKFLYLPNRDGEDDDIIFEDFARLRLKGEETDA